MDVRVLTFYGYVITKKLAGNPKYKNYKFLDLF